MDADEIKLVTEIDQRCKSNTKRLDRLEARQDNLEKLTETVATMQAELKNVLTAVGETKDAVRELQATPGKRWEAVVAAVIAAVVGLATGMMARGGI